MLTFFTSITWERTPHPVRRQAFLIPSDFNDRPAACVDGRHLSEYLVADRKKGGHLKARRSVILIAVLAAASSSLLSAQVGMTWDQQFPGPNRFKILSVFSNAAVLDKETGLVWERTPSSSIFVPEDAHRHCNTLSIGNRFGWRLPTIQELASLIDPTQANPSLPLGNPFTNINFTDDLYWSATTTPIDAPYSVGFGGHGEVTNGGGGGGNGSNLVWCVRGGQGIDVQ